MIEQIIISDGNKSFFHYLQDGETLKSIKPLSKINFFIGANNSGKSRLLRELLKEFYQFPIFDPELNLMSFDNPEIYTMNLIAYSRKDVIERLSEEINAIKPLCEPGETFPGPDTLMENKAILHEQDVQEIYMKYFMFGKQAEKKIKKISDEEAYEREIAREHLKKLLQKIEDLLPTHKKGTFVANYVPILRSLRTFLSGEYDNRWYKVAKRSEFNVVTGPIMANRVFWDYFTKSKKDNDPKTGQENLYEGQISLDRIFTGEAMYKKIYELRNDVESQRRILKDFEIFLGEQFFNGEHLELNALKIQGVENIYVKIGGESEYPIHELGDGIQAIMLLTFPLFYFRARKGHLLFYEEPEMFLHPGMQRIFIEAIRQFPNVQVFIATHSNHFLDTSVDYPEDISIFSMEKELKDKQPVFNIRNLSSPDMALLNLLGVRNSSVLMANCSIWVEGISDRIYIKKYLQLYFKAHPQKERRIFQEDLHFAFLEFGGNNIVHYSFKDEEANPGEILATRITNRIFLIHDMDSGKEERHKNLTKQLNENYYCLEGMEIENLLSPKILSATLMNCKLKAPGDVIFNTVKQEDYLLVPFVQAVQMFTHLQKLRKIFSNSTSTTTGKLLNKANFARLAVSHMSSWNDLSEQAKHLTEKIYKFIQSHNNNSN
jgi:predicted ATP-dependent endonuclease of OLD family